MSVEFRVNFDMNKAPNAAVMESQANEHIEGGLYEIGALLERRVIEHSPEGAFGARGGFKGSIFFEGRGVPVREMLIGTTSLYGEFVERGRKPGRMPPDAEIRYWVQKKMGIGSATQVREFGKMAAAFSGRTRSNKSDRAVGQNAAEYELDRAVFLIRAKIGRVGTKGHFPFFKAFEESHSQIEQLAQKIGVSIVAEWNGET